MTERWKGYREVMSRKGLIIAVIFAGIVCGFVWWGYAHLTTLVQARLAELAGKNVTVGRVAVRWNRVELEGVRIARNGSGKFPNRLAIERVSIRPSFLSIFRGRLDIADVQVDKPYILAEILPDGTLAKLFRPRTSGTASAPLIPLRIGQFRINDGSIDVLDWHAARKGGVGLTNPPEGYHLVSLRSISLSTGPIEFPLSELATPVQLRVTSKGGGSLSLNGKIAPKGLDATLALELADLDITRYRPYFLKKGDRDVTAGNLSGSCPVTIRSRNLHAPGKLRLKGLSFDERGFGGTVMGLPAAAVVKLMEDEKNELVLPFTINGSLDNPRFTIRQSLMDQLASGMASKLGIPTITSIGKGILSIGEKGIKGLFGSKGK